MAFDPCGTRKLEGDDILKLLAKELNVNVKDLKETLLNEIEFYKTHKELVTENKNEQTH